MPTGNGDGFWSAEDLPVRIGYCAGRYRTAQKKVQTGILASGVFVATCLPLMNKFLDISDELAAAEQENKINETSRFGLK